MKFLLKIFLILIIALGGSYYYFYNYYFLRAVTGANSEVVFQIQTGESFQSVAHRLEEQSLITQPMIFNLFARIQGLRGKIRAGEYLLNTGQSPKDILLTLVTGKSVSHPFTITEGLNSYEVALIFEKKGFGTKSEFLEACRDPKMLLDILQFNPSSCEGYLFPETYNFEKNTTARQMIEVMFKNFLKSYQEVSGGKSVRNWNRHQILTMASIIEKETGAPEERPKIASVFLNRIDKGMKLQTDPTVQYGILNKTGSFPQNITKNDLLTPTPYNTYTNYGLPPGPISNPGKESIRAVFQPAMTEFLYFVSQNQGTHSFSKTYEDHLKAVKDFQLKPKSREGKSWRDLNKKRPNVKTIPTH